MGIRWQGYKHPELYNMINKGPGASASEPQTTYWQGLAEELGKVDEDLNTSLTQLGAKWEGKAAENASSGLTPLAAWANDATTGSTVMKVSSENQAEYVSDARAKMPEPVEVTAQKPSTWDQIAAGAALAAGNSGPAVDVARQAADYEAQEAAKSEAEQRAIETMETYESSSTWNRNTLGTFVAPPDVVVATPEPQGGTGGQVLLNTAQVRNVGDNGGYYGGDSGSNLQNNPQVTPTPYPNGGNDGGSYTPPGGGNNGGGSVLTPPSVNQPPAGTSPQDVFTPPVTGGNPPYLPTNPGPGPGPGPNIGPNPYLPTGPFTNGDNNASDVARRAMPPVGPGRPGMADPFGRGMPGGPGGGLPGGIDGERSPSQLGRGGGVLGAHPESVVRSGPGAAGAAGARGNGVNGPMGAGGRRADGEDDDEHFAPDYLMETDDVFGDDRRVAPNVIGE